MMRLITANITGKAYKKNSDIKLKGIFSHICFDKIFLKQEEFL